MNSQVKIVNITLDRWQEYKAIRLEALELEAQAFGSKYSDSLTKPDKDWKERVSAAEIEDKDILLFAQYNGKLVGMIGAYFNKSQETRGIANIWGVYVNKQYRGQGIGKILLEEIINRLKSIPEIKQVKLFVNQDQKSAVGLYKKLGFHIVGTEQMILGDGHLHDELIFVKNLK